MANDAVSTTTEGMRAASNLFGDKVSTFNGYLGSVNGDMANLQSTWVGDASNQFNQAMDNWEGAFKNVINELIGMMQSMGTNTQTYTQQEEDASGIAQNFSTALPGF